jgi:hypothetical protein
VKHLRNLVVASLAAAFLAACSGGNGLSSMPLPVGLGRARHDDKQIFRYTGYEQTFVVPNYVTEVTIEADGASGGSGSGSYSSFPAGGPGGAVKATISVTPSESLAVFVGGEGTDDDGGYNGGGNPGDCNASCRGGAALGRFASHLKSVGPDNYFYNYPAYGGGGASDVRQGGDGLANRVAVAAGGGGAGGTADQCYKGCKDQDYDYGGAGGGGGGRAGGSGGGGSSSGGGGGGGSRTHGGRGGYGGVESSGSSTCDGTNGTRAELGDGGNGASGSCDEAGGGGGGGYYGGGGGGSSAYVYYCIYSGSSAYQVVGDSQYCNDLLAGGGAGGGGSSFVEHGAKHVKIHRGEAPAGSGRIIISW